MGNTQSNLVLEVFRSLKVLDSCWEERGKLSLHCIFVLFRFVLAYREIVLSRNK